MTTYTVLGVNDDADNCECCGKTGLKRVVWFRRDDTGQVLHFGTTCALNPEKGFGIDRQITAALNKADKMLAAIAQATSQRYRKAGGRLTVGNDGQTWAPDDQSLWDAIRLQVVAEYRKVNGAVFPMNSG